MIRRLYIEKKKGFDVEAEQMLKELISVFGIDPNSQLRLFERYDIEGLDDADFQNARDNIFTLPDVDNVFTDFLPVTESWQHFSYIPLNYKTEASETFSKACIKLLVGDGNINVASARVVALNGKNNSLDLERIKNHFANNIYSEIVSERKPITLERKDSKVEELEPLKFIELNDLEVFDLHRRMKFTMSSESLSYCRDYFKKCERNPYLVELKLIDEYWSDHCRHNTFNTSIRSIDVADAELNAPIKMALDEYYSARREIYGDRDYPITLMDIATIGLKLLRRRGTVPDFDESAEPNACSIQVPVEVNGMVEQWLVQFKNETSNLPTETAPFNGAAAAIGGAVRDPLSGRSYVYQAMRVSGSGDPTAPVSQTIKGKIPQRFISKGAADGFSSYSNTAGIATGLTSELYHEGYVAKRLETSVVVGASPKANVNRAKPNDGDVVVLVGGKTSGDGCGHATDSSKVQTKRSVDEKNVTVQNGDPTIERRLQRLIRNPNVSSMIKRGNDIGAGGLCIAVAEMCDGVIIDLDKVPLKYNDLDSVQIAISESNEQLVFVIEKDNFPKFEKYALEENLEVNTIVVVCDEPVLKVYRFGKCIANIHHAFLERGGVAKQESVYIGGVSKNTDYRNELPECLAGLEIPEAFIKNLSRLEVASQKGLSQIFDSSVGASTVLMPYGGKYQMTPEEAMIAKLPVLKGETDDVTVMSYGFTPKVTEESPFHGSAFAVMESLSKIAAVGANLTHVRLTFQEYFEHLNSVPARWGRPTAALLGAFAAQVGMGVAAVGGKDSMSGSYEDIDVPPTLISFALSMSKASNTISASFKKSESTILLIPMPVIPKTRMPDFDKARVMYRQFHFLSQNGKVLAASVVKEGGIAAAVAKMSFGNRIGVDFEPLDMQTLFSPITASIIVETENPSAFAGMNTVIIGKTTPREVFRFGLNEIEMDDALNAYTSKLESIYPTVAEKGAQLVDVPFYNERSKVAPLVGTASPQVVIPVFSFTSGEFDCARAFERAGGTAKIVVMRDRTADDIAESAQALADAISQSQIITLPGGVAGCDEPNGAGKYIAQSLRNPKIAEAIMELLHNRKGLILGLGEGFHALLRLGLITRGDILSHDENEATLTMNTAGTHISQMAYTRVTSVNSPWLSGCEVGDIHTVAVSHKYGRFMASANILNRMVRQGQIATQYVDINGKVASDMPFNPNGSLLAIEGLSSADGRIFGKMGHSERRGKDCYVNIPGNKDQKIFESGIKYFSI